MKTHTNTTTRCGVHDSSLSVHRPIDHRTQRSSVKPNGNLEYSSHAAFIRSIYLGIILSREYFQLYFNKILFGSRFGGNIQFQFSHGLLGRKTSHVTTRGAIHWFALSPPAALTAENTHSHTDEMPKMIFIFDIGKKKKIVHQDWINKHRR